MVPKGVRVTITDTDVATRGSLNRYQFAVDAPHFADALAGASSITVEVVSSDNPNIEPGEETSMSLFGERHLGFEAATERVRECQGPISSTFLQKLFRIKKRCGAFDNRRGKYARP